MDTAVTCLEPVVMTFRFLAFPGHVRAITGPLAAGAFSGSHRSLVHVQ
jgi:hypothetical protein